MTIRYLTNVLGIEVRNSDSILGKSKIFSFNNKEFIVYRNFGHYCIGRYKEGVFTPLILWHYNTLNEIYYALIYLFNINFPLSEIMHILIDVPTVFNGNSKLPERTIINRQNLSNYSDEAICSNTKQIVKDWLNFGWDKSVVDFDFKIEVIYNNLFIDVKNIRWI